jgi:hypothetical protein
LPRGFGRMVGMNRRMADTLDGFPVVLHYLRGNCDWELLLDFSEHEPGCQLHNRVWESLVRKERVLLSLGGEQVAAFVASIEPLRMARLPGMQPTMCGERVTLHRALAP